MQYEDKVERMGDGLMENHLGVHEDIGSVVTMVMETSRAWAWAERGQDLFEQVARLFQHRLNVDSGYVVYRKTALWREPNDELPQIYAPWGNVVPVLSTISDRLKKQLSHADPLQYLSEQWLTRDQVPELVRADWEQWGFCAGGSWPLTLGGERVGALILRRSRVLAKDDSMVMHLVALQMSLVLDLLRLRRVAEETSQRDILTGAYNRRGMMARLPNILNEAETRRQQVILGIFDVDDFKQINDQLGHPQGDHVLRAVADALRSHVHPEDLVARWGGDEFAVVIVEDPHVVMSEVVKRVSDGLKSLAQGVSVSAGWACWGRDGQTWESVYSAADQRLYLNKRPGIASKREQHKKYC